MKADNLQKAAQSIRSSKFTVVFTGAGISVESGIPPFRGEDGLWSRYDPRYLELEFFHSHPAESWKVMKQIFFDVMANARPNSAHFAIARLEQAGYVKEVITQNIDNLHQRAGSKIVHEFHGTIRTLVCVDCGKSVPSASIDLDQLPPHCNSCNGILKPDFIFFSETIPPSVNDLSFAAAAKADVMLLIGTTGEVMPASFLPYTAKEKNKATIIEVNPDESLYTPKITDIFLKGKAGEILPLLAEKILQE
jgi:NAD-dependent protein deacetylase/lipoamidase